MEKIPRKGYLFECFPSLSLSISQQIAWNSILALEIAAWMNRLGVLLLLLLLLKDFSVDYLVNELIIWYLRKIIELTFAENQPTNLINCSTSSFRNMLNRILVLVFGFQISWILYFTIVWNLIQVAMPLCICWGKKTGEISISGTSKGSLVTLEMFANVPNYLRINLIKPKMFDRKWYI